MIRKSLLLALPLFVLLGTVAAVFTLEHQRTPDWQVVLEGYLHDERAERADFIVRKSVAARQPWNFDAAMGRAQMAAGAWPWGIERLPYPLDALHCVLIARTSAANGTSTGSAGEQILYVAHHSDKLWRVGWLVHEGPTVPLDAKEVNHLAAVDCDFGQQLHVYP
jgi:hypothetical protein